MPNIVTLISSGVLGVNETRHHFTVDWFEREIIYTLCILVSLKHRNKIIFILDYR